MKTLSCEEFKQFVDPYIDGEFEATERALFDAHLGACPSCRRHFEHRTWFQRGIRPVLQRSVQGRSGLRERLQTRLRAERRDIEWKRRRKTFFSAGSAVLSVGLVVIFASPLVGFSPSVVDEVVDHHRLEMPLELPSTKAMVINEWFQEKLPFHVSAPTFHDRRVRLLGGRMSRVRMRNVRGYRPAAHLIYQVGQQKMSVLVFEDDEGRDAQEVTWHEQSGHRVAIFRRGRVRYAITARLQADEFRRVAATPW